MDETMTIKEVLEALSIRHTKLYSLVKEGELHPIRNALYKNNRGPVRFARSEVEDLKRRYGVA